MKKVVAGWLVLILLWMGLFAAFASEASISLLASDDEELAEDFSAETEDEEQEEFEEEEPEVSEAPAPAASGDIPDAPRVRWTYPVPLSALFFPYGKLVNRNQMLDETDEPADLMKMTVKRATSAAVYMDRTAGNALKAMFEAAAEAGYQLFLKSGYRSYGTQRTTYVNRLESTGGVDDGVVAPPGASEHQTGYACDILNEDYAGRPRMTTDFSETLEAQWMKENCAEFGFILRYPEDATDITGIIFEPWHFRYVGKELAGFIMGRGLTLEEFTDDWQMEVARFQGNGGDIDEWIAYEEIAKNAGPGTSVLDILGEDGDRETSISYPR